MGLVRLFGALFCVFKVGSAHLFILEPSTLASISLHFHLPFFSHPPVLSHQGLISAYCPVRESYELVNYSKYVSFYSNHWKIENVVRGLPFKRGPNLGG